MITLQNVVFPDPATCTEIGLFCHLEGLAALRDRDGTIHMRTGDRARFNTYFNSFSVGKWSRKCTLEGLFLELRGKGRMELQVHMAIPDRSWERLVSDVIELSEDAPSLVDLSHYRRYAEMGVIYFELRALGRATFAGGAFKTATEVTDWPRLAISITTFRREQAVRETVERLQAFLAGFEHRDRIRIQVIDTGQSAEIPPADNLLYVPNANLGGAGGFARGLQEAERDGFTHVLFTDDDAAFPMESLYRTYMMLALARDSRLTVAGAMINNTTKYAIWENGAIFDRACRPIDLGTDLRKPDTFLGMEFRSQLPADPRLYGGWWFFAFPVAHVRHYPFPFFVRGDDVSFSLANDFDITLLNGVVSFQDGFIEKETPLTWYLDLRSHLVHHLALPQMEIGAHGVARIGMWFLLRNFIRFQYETMEACLMAWEDALKGPEFFVENKDMERRRADLKALVQNEAFRPVDRRRLGERVRFDPIRRRWLLHLLRLSLNGHLLPFYARWANRIVVPPQDRGNHSLAWGTAEITYLNSDRTEAYTTRIDQRRGLKLLLKGVQLYRRTLRDYSRLAAAYREAYPEIASRGFWEGVYEMTEDASSRAVSP